MAQSSETARGKGRYEETDLERQTRQFKISDHNEDEVAISWRPYVSKNPDDELEVPLFPFQVYVLISARRVAEDVLFPRKLAALVSLDPPAGSAERSRPHSQAHFHFQVYSL